MRSVHRHLVLLIFLSHHIRLSPLKMIARCQFNEHRSERYFSNSRHWNNHRHDSYGAEADGKRRYGALGDFNRIRRCIIYGHPAFGQSVSGN
ncbi:hypothetical protein D3C78_912700 [compost metagenome]